MVLDNGLVRTSPAFGAVRDTVHLNIPLDRLEHAVRIKGATPTYLNLAYPTGSNLFTEIITFFTPLLLK